MTTSPAFVKNQKASCEVRHLVTYVRKGKFSFVNRNEVVLTASPYNTNLERLWRMPD